MKQTDNLELPLYEMDDMANLNDGYNAAMLKIDSAYQQIETRFPISSDNIEDGGINTVDLANGSVTTNKLASAAVTGEKIAQGTIELANLSSELQGNFNVNPTMIAFGDSYGVDSISEGPVWCEVAAKKLGITTLHNYCVGGATFNTTKEKNFSVQVDTAIAEITDPANVEYVGIVGGTNDGSNSITNALIALVTKINNAFPNATIGIGLNASKQDILSPGAKQKRVAALNLNGAINLPVFIDSIVYLELGAGCMMADNIHPTTLGSNRIGTAMAGILNGCIGGVVTSNDAVNTNLVNVSSLRSFNVTMNGRHIIYGGSVNATSSLILDLTTVYPDTIAPGNYYINDSNVEIVGYITTGSSGYPSVRINSSFSGVGYFGFESYVV